MGLPIFVVDAFTSEPFRGNPAGVVLDHGDDAWMQRVAAEMRHSETAFVRPRADGDGYDLRWFTPEVEVDLCGHATLASAHVLFETGRVARDESIEFRTRGGVLRACHAGAAGVTLDFPISVPKPLDTGDAELYAALGLPGERPGDFLESDGRFFLCITGDAGTVRGLEPDFAKLRAVDHARGAYVSAPGDGDYDIVSRCFAPRVGIDEDPVTGSMHCVLAAYWCARLGKDELRAFQASPRGGELTVRRAGDRVLLTGRATTVLSGELDA
jgi:PhzF family phenazine biosynthesis protein